MTPHVDQCPFVSLQTSTHSIHHSAQTHTCELHGHIHTHSGHVWWIAGASREFLHGLAVCLIWFCVLTSCDIYLHWGCFKLVCELCPWGPVPITCTYVTRMKEKSILYVFWCQQINLDVLFCCLQPFCLISKWVQSLNFYQTATIISSESLPWRQFKRLYWPDTSWT